MSASSRPVLTPLAARPSARLTAVVDLPTPPLPEATAMMCFTPGTSMRPPPPVRLAAGADGAVAVAVAMSGRLRRCGRRRRRGPLGRHDGGRRQHARHGADRLFAGLAQRLQGGAAGRIDVEGDRDMAAAGGDAAHHAQRHDILAGRRVDDGFENAADGRFADFRHVARFRCPAIFCRRLIEGIAAVTYMQRGVKAKVALRRAEAARP